MNGRLTVAIFILALTATVMVAILLDFVSVGFPVGPFRFSHWMTWIGTLFVAVYVPIYHVIKLQDPKHIKVLLDIHNFGFLVAFLLISVHFAGQMSRPHQAFPDLGEGIALYVTMVLLVATGMWQRFGPRTGGAKRRYNLKVNRLVHTSLISAFYIIVTVHAAVNMV